MDDGYTRTIRINPGFRKPSFSNIEVRDIAISIVVLTLAFTIILSRSIVLNDDRIVNLLYILAISAVLVVTSFMLHEFGHKFVAQRYGAWAEYRMFPMGLVITVLTAFIGFLFAAPGAVYIQGRIDTTINGKISAAGPAVNLGMSIVTLLIGIAVGGIAGSVLLLLAYFNAFLGTFNLIPIPPLDGSKIVRWNPAVYVAMLALGLVLLYILW